MSGARSASEQGSEWFEGPDSIEGLFEGESCFEGSSLTADALADFFVAARELWTAWPSAMTDDEPLLHLEAAMLDIDDGCLSIMGGLGGARGFAFYPSALDYEQAIEAAAGAWPDGWPAPHCGLYFSFESAESVPAVIQKQITARGFSIANEAAYPNLQSVIYGLPAPPVEAELRLATTIMRALVSLVQEHSRALRACEDIRASYRDESGLEMVMIFPHPVLQFEPEPRPRALTLSSLNPYQLPLATRELERLAHALGSFTLHRVVGMFCAVCSVPEPPSHVTWLSEIIRNLLPASGAQRRYALDQLEVVYHHVVRTLREDDIDGLVPEAGDVAACREWARGYAFLLGRVHPRHFEVDLAAAAFPIQVLAEIPQALARLDEFRGEERRADVMERFCESLAGDAHYLFQAWDYDRAQHDTKTVERAAPKLGRNEPCRCGSGKKFKKCCAI
jgi:hypothetical protein